MFTKQTFPLAQTRLFDPLLLDYVSGAENIKPYYTYSPDSKGFGEILQSNAYGTLNRTALVTELKAQANRVSNTSAKSLEQIRQLADSKTFTITTGHQLCLFTGPLFFVYKIISVINTCKTLKQLFPSHHFVPVYWMASEDHDAAEINHAHVYGKTLTWPTDQAGAVGNFSTESLSAVIGELKQVLGTSPQAQEFSALIEEAYLKHQTLADATRYLVNALFGDEGIVILDGDSKALKQLFTSAFEKDIFGQQAYASVSATNAELSKDYHVQVNPREINIFYKEGSLRERIVREGDKFNVLNSAITFSEAEMKNLIHESPEKLSPNVVLRPLYQQAILPNIAYVGGPGELAYWLEYKAMFAAFGIQLPVLVPRQFIAVIDKGTASRLEKFNFSTGDIFEDTEELIKRLVKQNDGGVHFDVSKHALESAYQVLLNDVLPVDKSLQGAVEAEKQKALNGLAAIEQKVLRALKQRSETDINQVKGMKAKLFPENTPQERYDNISMYYAKYGRAFIDMLKEHLTCNLEPVPYTVLVEQP